MINPFKPKTNQKTLVQPEKESIQKLLSELMSSKNILDFSLQIEYTWGTKTTYRKDVEATDLP